MDWIDLSQAGALWRDFVKTVMNFAFLLTAWNFLTSLSVVIFYLIREIHT
jgi:hypothetical protein